MRHLNSDTSGLPRSKALLTGSSRKLALVAALMAVIIVTPPSTNAGWVVVWGQYPFGQLRRPAAGDIIDVSQGANHALALTDDGAIVAWGWNNYNQSDPPAGNDFVAVSAGYTHSLALNSDGSIVGWGSNYYNQATPPAGNDFIAVAAGHHHSVALKADGSIIAWGWNLYNQLDTPSGNDFIAVSAGSIHSIALKSDGAIVGWGDNRFNQSDPPTGNDFITLVAGGYHNLALRIDGSIAGWGQNASNQASPPIGNDFIAIAAGGPHSLALKGDGSVVGWGANSYGVLDIPPGSDYLLISAGGVRSLALRSTLPPATGVVPLSLQFSSHLDVSAYAEAELAYDYYETSANAVNTRAVAYAEAYAEYTPQVWEDAYGSPDITAWYDPLSYDAGVHFETWLDIYGEGSYRWGEMNAEISLTGTLDVGSTSQFPQGTPVTVLVIAEDSGVCSPPCTASWELLIRDTPSGIPLGRLSENTLATAVEVLAGQTLYVDVAVSADVAGEDEGGLLRIDLDFTTIDTATPPVADLVDYGVTSSSVQVGEYFRVYATFQNAGQGAGNLGGISISFPQFTEVDQNMPPYNSSQGWASPVSWQTTFSTVDFYDAGDTIDIGGSPGPAEHLLVEGSLSSWIPGEEQTLTLGVRSEQAGQFEIRVRGWIIKDGQRVYRDPDTSGTGRVRDQQTYWSEVLTITVEGDQLLEDHFGPATLVGAIDYAGHTYSIAEHTKEAETTATLPYTSSTFNDSTFVRDAELAKLLLRTHTFRRFFELRNPQEFNVALDFAQHYHEVTDLRGPWFIENIGPLFPGSELVRMILSKRATDKAVLGLFVTKAGFDLLPAAIAPASAGKALVSSAIESLIGNINVEVEPDEIEYVVAYYQWHEFTPEGRRLLDWAGVTTQREEWFLDVLNDGYQQLKSIEGTAPLFEDLLAALRSGNAAAIANARNAFLSGARSLGLGILKDLLTNYALNIDDLDEHVKAAAVIYDLHMDALNGLSQLLRDDLLEWQALYATPVDDDEVRARIQALEKQYAHGRGLLFSALLEDLSRSLYARGKSIRDTMPDWLATAYGATPEYLQRLTEAVFFMQGIRTREGQETFEYNATCMAAEADVATAREILAEAVSLSNLVIAEPADTGSSVGVGVMTPLELRFTNTLGSEISSLSVTDYSPYSAYDPKNCAQCTGITYDAQLSSDTVPPGGEATITVNVTVPSTWYDERLTVNEGLVTKMELPLTLRGLVDGVESEALASCRIDVVPLGYITDVRTERVFARRGDLVEVDVFVQHSTEPNPEIVMTVISPTGLAGVGSAPTIEGMATFELDFDEQEYGPYGLQMLLMDESGTTILTPWHAVNKIVYLIPPIEGDLTLMSGEGVRVFCHSDDIGAAERILAAAGVTGGEVITTDNRSLSQLIVLAREQDSVVIGTPTGENELLDHLIATDPRLSFAPTREGEMIVQVLQEALNGSNDVTVVSGFRDRDIDIALMALAEEWRCQITAPVITQQPENQSVCVNGRATIGITVEGAEPLSYQWRKDGENLSNGGNISGATTDTLTIDPAGLGDEAVYDAVVSNICDEVTSDPATLTVNSGPSITQQPENQTVCAGDPATFSVVAEGTQPLSYQWRKDRENLVDGGNISGATTDRLTIDPVGTVDEAVYDVVVSNACGEDTSDPVTLALIDPCDMNCDGDINALDIEPFLDLLFGPNPDPCDTCTGDVNGDGSINALDIEPFLECLFGP